MLRVAGSFVPKGHSIVARRFIGGMTFNVSHFHHFSSRQLTIYIGYTHKFLNNVLLDDSRKSHISSH